MQIKGIIILTISLFVANIFINPYEDDRNSKEIIKEFEAEEINFSNKDDYIIRHDKEFKYIRIKKYSSIESQLNLNINEKCILWMYAKIINPQKASFYLNDEKLSIKEQYYFKWIKLKDFDSITNLSIKINNEDAVIDIGKFYITKTDIAPYFAEYVFNDIKVEVIKDRLKILFSGIDLKYADVTLYRRMTSEGYEQYLKDKYNGRLSSNYLSMLLKKFDAKYEKVNTAKISENYYYYFIEDNKPLRYQCEYYVVADNCFGESLESKRIILTYHEYSNNIVEKSNDNKLNNAYFFKRHENKIDIQKGNIKETKEGEKLFISKNIEIEKIPFILKDSYYYQGTKDNENINFNTNKPTEIFIYVPELDLCYSNYYYEKGFKLMKLPVKLTNDSEKYYSYFFCKTYRSNTGDSILLENQISDNKNIGSFRAVVDNDDIIVNFDDNNTLLIDSDEVYVKCMITNDKQKIIEGKMTKVKKNLWQYRIKNGTNDCKEIKFHFYNEKNRYEINSDWYWNFEKYLKNYDDKTSNVVFFKELDTDDIDIDFNVKYKNDYKGFEGYLIDDGSIYSPKGKNINYGVNKEVNLFDIGFISKDNAKGYFDNNVLRIEYNSLNSKLVNSENIKIKYSFDNWATYHEKTMDKIGYSKWQSELYPLYDSLLSFNFCDDLTIDDNIGFNWNWDYKKEKFFNTGYEREIVKSHYIELPCRDNNDEDLNWRVDIDNGIYDIYLLIEKENKNKESIIEINNKPYILNETYKELVEIKDQILVYNNKILIKNTSDDKIKIYSFLIKKDNKQISDRIICPDVFNYDKELFEEKIEDKEITIKNDEEIIKVEFNLENIYNKKINFIFNAASNNNNNDLIYLSTSKDFKDESLLSVIKLSNDLKEYKIDITEYKNQIIHNNNKFTLYIKAKKGTKILTGKNVLAPFIIKTYITLDKGSNLYQGMGVINFAKKNYIFTEDKTNRKYNSISQTLDLRTHLNELVMVSGYIIYNRLYILQAIPVITIKEIIYNKYTNEQPVKFEVISDQHLTGLTYRIRGVNKNKWKTVTGTIINQEIPNDGTYTIEILPISYGYKGALVKELFIVDRSGPKLYVKESIPQYTKETKFEIEVQSYDNYTNKNEISTFYKINSKEEVELSIINGKATLILEEGILNIEIYCKDNLDNIGNIYTKKIIVDITPPEILKIDLIYPVDNSAPYYEWTAKDDFSAILDYCYSIDGETWINSRDNRHTPAIDYPHVFRIKTSDELGNWSRIFEFSTNKEGLNIIHNAGLQLEIKKESTDINFFIRIKTEDNTLPANSNAVRIIGPIFSITSNPENITFKENCNLTLSYAEQGVDESWFTVYRYDEQGEQWQALERNVIDKEKNRITVSINHFSYYAVGYSFFRVGSVDFSGTKKWCFVDPLGNPFFSTGVNEVNGKGNLDENDKYVYMDAIKKKYGEEHWQDLWLADTKTRLKQWNFNTLAPWANYTKDDDDDPPIVDEFQMPYTINLDVCKDLTDVFSDKFDITLQRIMTNYIVPDRIEIVQAENSILNKITDSADKEFILSCYSKIKQGNYILDKNLKEEFKKEDEEKYKKEDQNNKIKNRILEIFKTVGYTPSRIIDPNLIGYYYVGEYDWASIGYNDEGANCMDLFYRYFDLYENEAGKKELIDFLDNFYHGNINQFKYEMGLYICLTLSFIRLPVYDCYPQITSFDDLLKYRPTVSLKTAQNHSDEFIPMPYFTLAVSDLMPGIQDIYQDLTDMLDDFMNMRMDKIGDYAPDFISTYNGLKTLIHALKGTTLYAPGYLEKCDEVFSASGLYDFMDRLNAAKEEAKDYMSIQMENITNTDKQIDKACNDIDDALNKIEEIEDKIDDIKDEMKEKAKKTKKKIKEIMGDIPNKLEDMFDDISDALGAPDELKDLIKDILGHPPGNLPGDIDDLLDDLEDKMEDLAEEIDDLRPEKKAKEKLVKDLEKLKSELEAQKKPIQELIAQIKTLDQQLKNNLGITKYVDEIKNEIAKFMKMLEFPDVRKAWTKHVADNYFKKCHAAIKSVDQNHLILGSQFIAWCTPKDVVESISHYTDVVSINHYNLALGLAQGDPLQQIADTASKIFDFVRFGNFDEFYALSGKPLVIGEFCFVADENLSGCHNSYYRPLPRVKTQSDRAAVFVTQVEEYLKLDYFIGYHWWKYIDCPPGGRDQEGEDFNSGLVSINDEIYKELTAEMQRMNGIALDFTQHRLPITNNSSVDILKPIIQK